MSHAPRGPDRRQTEPRAIETQMAQMITDLREQLAAMTVERDDLATCYESAKVTKWILKDQLAAMTAERDDLLQARAICPSCAKRIDEAAEVDVAALNTKLAASQADNARLRGSLQRLACLGNGNKHGNSLGNVIAQDAIATQPDTTALDERLRAERLQAQINILREAGKELILKAVGATNIPMLTGSVREFLERKADKLEKELK